MVSRTWSATSMTTFWSSASSGSSSSVRTAGWKRIDQFEGSGSSPSGPSQGKVGVMGKYGMPVSRASSDESPSIG